MYRKSYNMHNDYEDLETLIKVFTFGSDDFNSCDHLILQNSAWRKSARISSSNFFNSEKSHKVIQLEFILHLQDQVM